MNKRKRHITIYYHASRVVGAPPPAWVIAWATPDGHGHRISSPLGRYATRPEAVRARRAIYDELGLYAMAARSAEVREVDRRRREWLKKEVEDGRRVAARTREIWTSTQCKLIDAVRLARAEVSS